MSMTQTERPDAAVAPAEAPPPLPDPAAFRSGQSEEDRLVAQVAFALAAERRLPATPDNVEALRTQAGAALSDFAFRYLHNRAEEIRQEAVSTRLAQLRRPPGFVRLVLANLVALAVAGLAAAWAVNNSDILAGLIGG